MAVFHAPCNMHVPRLFSVFDRQNSAMAALDPPGRGPTIDHRPSMDPGHRNLSVLAHRCSTQYPLTRGDEQHDTTERRQED
jgi:hypothetical protein